MTFSIPNADDAAYTDQAEPDSVDIDILASGIAGIGILEGCAVEAQDIPDMTVAVSAGSVQVLGVEFELAADAALAIGAADSSNPRFDLVVARPADVGYEPVVIAGTASTSAVFPTFEASVDGPTPIYGDVVLAAVYVPAGATTIAADQITDKRSTVNPFVPRGGSSLQILQKQSDADGDAEWVNVTAEMATVDNSTWDWYGYPDPSAIVTAQDALDWADDLMVVVMPLLEFIASLEDGDLLVGEAGLTGPIIKLSLGTDGQALISRPGGPDMLVWETLTAAHISDLGTAALEDTSAFDAAGTAATAVSNHAGAVDPHGDRAYADTLIAANDAMVFEGVIDCSANPNYPAADRGHTYRVSVAGKIGGASGTNVEVGDLILCITDGTVSGTQAAVGANWAVVQTNIDGAVVGPASAVSGDFSTFSGTSGKVIQDSGLSLDTDVALAANSDTKIPSQKAAKAYVDGAISGLGSMATESAADYVEIAGDTMTGDLLSTARACIGDGAPTFGLVEKFRVGTPTTVSATANAMFAASAAAAIPLVVQEAAGQTAYSFEIQDSAGDTVVAAYPDSGQRVLSVIADSSWTTGVDISAGSSFTGMWGYHPSNSYWEVNAYPDRTYLLLAGPTGSDTEALRVSRVGDLNERYRVHTSGLTEWGDGTASRDTNLYRSAADTLKTDDSFLAARTAINGSAFGTVEKFRVNTPTTALNNTNVVLSGAAAADRVLGIELAPAATTFPFAVYDSASSALASISTAGVINSVTALSVGSTVAGSGAVRLPNATSISWRNAANTGDKSISLSSANATDGLNLPGQVIVGGSDATAGTLSFFSGTVGIKRSGATGLMLYASDPTNGDIHINSNGRVAVNTTISAGTFANGTVEYLRVNDPTTVSNTANTMLAASATTATPLTLQMATSQTASPFEMQNSGGLVIASMSTSGSWVLPYGIVQMGTVPATTGQIRMPNNTSIAWRNAANSANIVGIQLDGSDNLTISGGTGGTYLQYNGTSVLSIGSTAASRVNVLTGNAFLSDFVRVSATTGSLGTVEKLRVNSPTTTDNSANVTMAATATTVTPLVVQLAASHTDSAIEVQDSTGAVLASVSPNGTVTATALKTTAQSHGATSTTETLDLANGDVHGITLDANCTLTLSGATSGKACAMTVIVTQDGTGGWTLTWPASVKWPAGTAPTLTGTAGSVDAFTLLTIDGGTTWYGVTAGLAFG